MELNASKTDTRIARRQMLAWVIAALSAFALAWSGFGSQIEQQLQNGREILLQKPASGELVLLEIDAKSLREQNKWPWPRSLYAEAVDRLDAEGAAQIAFDIDFSSQSSAAQDAAFAEALSRANATVILPTFLQDASLGSAAQTESLPIPELRKNALIASVNVHPDGDGQVNNYSFGTKTAGMPRPSLPSMLAESSGHIEHSFLIDQSIDQSTIPRISFGDLLANRPLPIDLSGKRVLIGATAIELGDRYPVRRYGVIPGVVIQALAAETLIQNTAVINLGSIPAVLLAGLILLALMRTFKAKKLTGAVIVAGAGLFILLLALEALHLATFSIVPALFLLGLFLTLRKFFHTSMDLKTSRYFNAVSGLPNEASLKEFVADAEDNPIVVLRIMNFGDALAMSDTQSRSQLYQNLSLRLNFLAAGGKVFH
ncbi:MAG: CHASE2 domain-containing protein, partial [Hyphomicrobiales bacterium]